MNSRIKSLKDGAYEYDENNKLGQGSFAIVYKGIITKNNRVVAIRLLPLTLLKQYGNKIKQIITGQVKVLKQLSLSDSKDAMFTTRIFDCFITNNNVVMILEFCPEGNLEDHLSKGPIPQPQALQIIYQLARGLQFISKQNVVHRDIKPDNIFIKMEGNYKIFKLGDFGFAVKKQLNSQIVGTPIFMSPELFRLENYGSEVDVWAFGLLAHYVLFKEYYFFANSQNQVKKRVLNEKYQLKPPQQSKLSKQMSHFLYSCLQFNKKDRLQAKKLSQHPVFNPVRQKISLMMDNVLKIQNMMESQLLKSTVKGKAMNEIVKFNFLIQLAQAFQGINKFNLASLYIYKHALGQLNELKSIFKKKINFLNHPDWLSFCQSQDYSKSTDLIQSLMQKCQKQFQNCYVIVIQAMQSQFGPQVSQGIKQNLGQTPFDRIKPEICKYQLEKTWFPWIQNNKNQHTHLLGLQLILGQSIYLNQHKNFNFTTYQMMKTSMNLQQRISFMENALKNLK